VPHVAVVSVLSIHDWPFKFLSRFCPCTIRIRNIWVTCMCLHIYHVITFYPYLTMRCVSFLVIILHSYLPQKEHTMHKKSKIIQLCIRGVLIHKPPDICIDFYLRWGVFSTIRHVMTKLGKFIT
jgi:hypothetical protein